MFATNIFQKNEHDNYHHMLIQFAIMDQKTQGATVCACIQLNNSRPKQQHNKTQQNTTRESSRESSREFKRVQERERERERELKRERERERESSREQREHLVN
jgi:hypothetical protein